MRILYIDIDSLRPDHLGCYGYTRATSPNIGRHSPGKASVSRIISRPMHRASRRVLRFTLGRFGIQTGVVVGHGGTAASPRIQGPNRGFTDSFGEQGLARQLQLRGLHTAMISTFGQRHGAHWFYAGFNEIHNNGQGRHGIRSSCMGSRRVRLERHAASDKWFLHVNFWDPHTPYRVAWSPIGSHLPMIRCQKWLTPEVLAQHQRVTGPHTALDIGMYEARPEKGGPTGHASRGASTTLPN